MPDNVNCTSVSVQEPVLDDVHADDKQLVREAISVLATLRHPVALCKSWNVNLVGLNYELVGFVDTKAGEWEVLYEDLDIIRQLDYARIGPISVKGSNTSVQIKVRILAKSTPIMVTQCDIIRIQKRRKWFA